MKTKPLKSSKLLSQTPDAKRKRAKRASQSIEEKRAGRKPLTPAQVKSKLERDRKYQAAKQAAKRANKMSLSAQDSAVLGTVHSQFPQFVPIIEQGLGVNSVPDSLKEDFRELQQNYPDVVRHIQQQASKPAARTSAAPTSFPFPPAAPTPSLMATQPSATTTFPSAAPTPSLKPPPSPSVAFSAPATTIPLTPTPSTTSTSCMYSSPLTFEQIKELETTRFEREKEMKKIDQDNETTRYEREKEMKKIDHDNEIEQLHAKDKIWVSKGKLSATRAIEKGAEAAKDAIVAGSQAFHEYSGTTYSGTTTTASTSAPAAPIATTTTTGHDSDSDSTDSL